MPEEERVFRPKPELGLDIVRNARKNHLRLGWVGADAGYGKGPAFCYALDKMGEIFMVDVHTDFHVYLEAPRHHLPEKTGKRVRSPIRYQTDLQSIELQEVAHSHSSKNCRTVTLRNTTRGELKVRCCRLSVYVWDGEWETAKGLHWLLQNPLGPNRISKSL